MSLQTKSIDKKPAKERHWNVSNKALAYPLLTALPYASALSNLPRFENVKKEYVMSLSLLFPAFSSDVIYASNKAFHLLFPDIPIHLWERNNTWIEYWGTGSDNCHGTRIAFAPHKGYSSLYFQTPDATLFYTELGGRCPANKYSINLSHACNWDPTLLRTVVAHVLNQVTS